MKIHLVYLNRIVIHSCILTEHIVHFTKVVSLLTEYGLKARHAKCARNWQNVNYGGNDIDTDSIQAQEHITCVEMD